MCQRYLNRRMKTTDLNLNGWVWTLKLCAVRNLPIWQLHFPLSDTVQGGKHSSLLPVLKGTELERGHFLFSSFKCTAPSPTSSPKESKFVELKNLFIFPGSWVVGGWGSLGRTGCSFCMQLSLRLNVLLFGIHSWVYYFKSFEGVKNLYLNKEILGVQISSASDTNAMGIYI